MQLYSYWARAALDCHTTDGSPYHLVAYAGSDASPTAAEEAAKQLLQVRYARLLGSEVLGEYPTGTTSLREQLVRRVHDTQGKVVGAVTRNRYGSLVLNTPHFMMLDVDDQDLRRGTGRQPDSIFKAFSFRNFLRKLFAPATPQLPPLDVHEQLQLRLAAWVQLYPEWNFRLYRTRLGFRLLVTHQMLDPNSPEAQNVFAAMRTDELYVRLCQTQNCYRARLNPKPWRIGWSRPPLPFPYDTPEQHLQQQEWEQQYNARSAAFSVCKWVGEYGSGVICPEAKALIELHDQACLGDKELA